MTDPAQAIADTRRWVERIVIGLGLCPFAAAPFKGDRIRYTVCPARDAEGIYRAFLAELQAFFEADPQQVETALFIVPQGLEDFDDYLDLLVQCEDALDEAGLGRMFQLASFHPDYLFDGSATNDPANFTNRSPWPLMHLIREDGLAAALESYSDPEQIPVRNVALLRKLGVAGIRRLLED